MRQRCGSTNTEKCQYREGSTVCSTATVSPVSESVDLHRMHQAQRIVTSFQSPTATAPHVQCRSHGLFIDVFEACRILATPTASLIIRFSSNLCHEPLTKRAVEGYRQLRLPHSLQSQAVRCCDSSRTQQTSCPYACSSAVQHARARRQRQRRQQADGTAAHQQRAARWCPQQRRWQGVGRWPGRGVGSGAALRYTCYMTCARFCRCHHGA